MCRHMLQYVFVLHVVLLYIRVCLTKTHHAKMEMKRTQTLLAKLDFTYSTDTNPTDCLHFFVTSTHRAHVLIVTLRAAYLAHRYLIQSAACSRKPVFQDADECYCLVVVYFFIQPFLA